jgi:hypothetical protein
MTSSKLQKKILRIYAIRQKAHDLLLDCDVKLDTLVKQLMQEIVNNKIKHKHDNK